MDDTIYYRLDRIRLDELRILLDNCAGLSEHILPYVDAVDTGRCEQQIDKRQGQIHADSLLRNYRPVGSVLQTRRGPPVHHEHVVVCWVGRLSRKNCFFWEQSDRNVEKNRVSEPSGLLSLLQGRLCMKKIKRHYYLVSGALGVRILVAVPSFLQYPMEGKEIYLLCVGGSLTVDECGRRRTSI